MTELRRIIKDTVISLIGQGISWLSTLLLSFAYGHFLGASKFGELYFAITFVTLIGVVVEAGFSNQTIRDVVQEPALAARYFSNILLVKLSIWLIMYFVMLLVSWLLGYTLEVRMLIAICGFDLLCNAIANVFVSMHYAFKRAVFPVVGNILEKGLTALLGFLLLRAGTGVQVMAVVLVGGSLVNVIWQAIWYFRMVGASFVIDLKLISELVRTNIPFLISGLLTVGYSSMDTILLSKMVNSSSVGWYGAASRITDTMSFLPNIVISNIMYPVFSKLSTTSDTDLKLALEKSINVLLICSIPISTILVIFAPEIIVLLYGGRGFSQSIRTLQVLAPYVIFLYFDYPLVLILLSKKLDRKILVISIVGLVFNLSLNVFLIQIYQHVGSAFAASLTELLLCVVCIAFIPKKLRPVGSLPVALKALAASLVMAIVVLILHILQIFILLPIAMLVYLGASLLFGTVPREDYLAIYHAIRKKVPRNQKPGNDASLETLVPLYDLSTVLIPAYYNREAFKSGSLLNIELAVTGALPVIRLPLASQRTGLVTNNLSNIPAQLCTLPITPAPTEYLNNMTSSLDIDMVTTEKLPTIYLKTKQSEIDCSSKSAMSVVTSDSVKKRSNPINRDYASDNRG